MYPDLLARLGLNTKQPRQRTMPSRQTKAQYKQQELKREMARSKRQRLSAARKANRGNQFARGR